MTARFDPDAQLPIRLQRRIDSWSDRLPRSQFQAYGPLTAYFHAVKFPPARFIVKPQALLRVEEEELYDPQSDLPRPSIDSHGVEVKNIHKLPDFTICQYWGAPTDHGADIVRVLVEVGSNFENDRLKVQRQVLNNLDLVGARWKGTLLGVGIIGNEVYLVKNTTPQGNFMPISQAWFPLFGQVFINELNNILTISAQYEATMAAQA